MTEAIEASSTLFGHTRDGEPVHAYTLEVPERLKVVILDYGATIQQIWTPDASGAMADVALGYRTVAEYERASTYFGATIGRVGNRIAGGKVSLGGRHYTLATNNHPKHGAPCHLHGGKIGFSHRRWKVESYHNHAEPTLALSYHSPDGEEGYPGALDVRVVFRLTREGALSIDYAATCDRDTFFNPTNHTYFNLSGEDAGDILGHELQLRARHFTPVDGGMIPTGEIRPVAETVFDFREPKTIGRDLESDDEQLRLAGGFDHNFVLDGPSGSLRSVAEVHDPRSGRVLETFTTEPGVQFYAGNSIGSSEEGKNGQAYVPRAGFCLETQHFPDAPNQSAFPSILLERDEDFSSQTIYRFDVRPAARE